MLQIRRQQKVNMIFWDNISLGRVLIDQNRLLEFLGKNGFGQVELSKGDFVLVHTMDNIIDKVTRRDLINSIRDNINLHKEEKVIRAFINGSFNYLNKSKYDFLPEITNVDDKDPKEAAWFYYKNTAVEVSKKGVKLVPYSNLKHTIWADRILDREFHMPSNNNGQFRDFVEILSKKDAKRFLAMQSMLGYLLHRYNSPSTVKAVILYDELQTLDGKANGGTGKSLLGEAIKRCKNVVTIDGKNTKANSRFKNQRVKNTTDVLFYDDLDKSFSLEEVFSMLTSGIVIEKKGKQEIHLKAKDSPKFLISSNTVLNGPGGASDIRKRYEFEIANHYNEKHQPKDDFGNEFFDDWDDKEWSRFDLFMMNCVKVFFTNGLIEPAPINLKTNKLISGTSNEFISIVENNLPLDSWIDKRKFRKEYNVNCTNQLSSKALTIFCKEYAKQNDLIYESKNSGGELSFRLVSPEIKDDVKESTDPKKDLVLNPLI